MPLPYASQVPRVLEPSLRDLGKSMLPTFLSLRGVPPAHLSSKCGSCSHQLPQGTGLDFMLEGIPTFPGLSVVKCLGLWKMLKRSTKKPCLVDQQQTHPGQNSEWDEIQFSLICLMISFSCCFINRLQLQLPVLIVTVFPMGKYIKTWGLKGVCVPFLGGRRTCMMKFQLQSVDIFRIDPVIWGAMERIFKIQTGLYNVKQKEALPVFKLPLCLSLLDKSSLSIFSLSFSQLPFRGVFNPYEDIRDRH